MTRRRVSRPLIRRAPTRKPKARFLVVVEGKTEKAYLDDFARSLRGVVSVEVIFDDPDPVSLVKHCIRKAEEAKTQSRNQDDINLLFDETWCVFDFETEKNRKKVEEAVRLAKRNSIRTAISNPSIELWAILHFRDFGEVRTARDLERILREYVPAYKKKRKIFLHSDIASGYQDALARAKVQLKQRENDGQPGGNPSTAIFLLTERVRKKAK